MKDPKAQLRRDLLRIAGAATLAHGNSDRLDDAQMTLIYEQLNSVEQALASAKEALKKREKFR